MDLIFHLITYKVSSNYHAAVRQTLGSKKKKKTIIRKFKYQNNWVRECARDYRIRRKKKHFKFRILPSEKST